jgi:hypothetical protein
VSHVSDSATAEIENAGLEAHGLGQLSRRNLLAGAAGLATVLAASGRPDVAAAATTTPASPEFNVKTYGATGNGSTDDTAAIRATFAAAQGSLSAGVPGGTVYFPAGEYVISGTITLTRFSGVIYGDGQGQSPAYAAQPGNASVIRWNGSNSIPMFEVLDSLLLKFRDLRLEGKSSSPPTYGIQFNNAGGDTGCNHYCAVEDVFIGRYPWSSQGTNMGVVQSCVGFTGTDGNNDQFHLSRVRFSCPTTYGLYLPNSQSVWGSLQDCFFDTCGVAGVSTNSNLSLYNATFNACAIDLQVGPNVADTPSVSVFGWYSENSGQMASVGPQSALSVWGGTVQCGTVQSGGHVLIAAYPSGEQTIVIHNVLFTQMTTPADVQIKFGPQSPTYVGRVFMTIDQCQGISSSQLVLSGSMWATSPMSRCILQWQSQNGNNFYQFRNELATSGSGTRSQLNTGVWDAPVAGSS